MPTRGAIEYRVDIAAVARLLVVAAQAAKKRARNEKRREAHAEQKRKSRRLAILLSKKRFAREARRDKELCTAEKGSFAPIREESGVDTAES